jgi:hypothetical protein
MLGLIKEDDTLKHYWNIPWHSGEFEKGNIL